MSPDKQVLDELRIDRSSAPRSRPWIALILIALVVAAGAWGAYRWFRLPKALGVRTVLVQQPSSNADRTLLNASGYVTARREATVSSKITGRIVEVLVEEGMAVEEGQVLARLDSSNIERSLRLAEAQVESARRALDETRAALEQAEREYRRADQLLREGIASVSERDQAETDLKTLEARLERQAADVEVAERELAVWRQQLDDTVIRAPFAGVLTSKDAQPGEMVSPMSAGGGFTRTGICTLVDMSSLEIEVDVSESYINRVQPGQRVVAVLDSYPEWQIPARVIAIIPTADRQKATVKVRVGFDELDPRILPDMSVKVAFQSEEEPEEPERRELTVPRSAVRRSDGRHIVWVVRDGTVERRAVTIEEGPGDEIVVAAGLEGGERIVVDGPEELVEGAKVVEVNG